MSFKCTLDVAGKIFEVLECSVYLAQKFDKNGRPVSGVSGGKIIMFLEGSDSDILGAWIADPTKKQDGTITFFRIDQDSKFKQVDFEDAYAIGLVESFIHDVDTYALELEENEVTDEYNREMHIRIMNFHKRTNYGYVIVIEISAQRITIDGVEHDNKW